MCRMAASNWPVSARFADYATVQQIAQGYFAQRGDDALARVMGGNAREAYRLPQAPNRSILARP